MAYKIEVEKLSSSWNATFDVGSTHGFSMAIDKDKAIRGAVSQLKKHLGSDDVDFIVVSKELEDEQK